MYRRSTYVDIPESILQLPLHGLHVRVLHQEGGAQLTELSKLDLSGAVLVNLEQQLLELLLGGSEAHGPHDLSEVISGEEINFLGVKQVKAGLEENIFENIVFLIYLISTHFETLDLVSCQPSDFVDFIKVDARVSVSSHGVCPCVLSYCWELLLYVEQDRENRYEMTGPGPPPLTLSRARHGCGVRSRHGETLCVIVTSTYHLLQFPDGVKMMFGRS